MQALKQKSINILVQSKFQDFWVADSQHSAIPNAQQVQLKRLALVSVTNIWSHGLFTSE
jgi:hypothetical protein